ncbi:MAG: 50S ribosomal protein L11 methyltransferase [Vicinamibacterales bacterium]
MRHYPALRLTWPSRPTDDAIERTLAVVDDTAPTGYDREGDAARIFFASPAARDLARELLRTADPALVCASVDVPDEDWAERSQAALGPVRVGALVVAPPWVPPDGSAPWITIVPSMGFGTGHHASTRLCLALAQSMPLAGCRVLDAGTGSGVLAIAAWRLGAAAVTAVDLDQDAVDCAIDNVARNGAAGGVAVRALDVATGAAALGRVDVVFANLTGDLLARQAALLVSLLEPDGQIVVSGVMTSEEAGVAGAFSAAGARIVERRAEDEWVGLRLTRSSGPA